MGRPRSEDARRRVLEAAVSALLAQGVEGATIEEIAERSGVAKSTIYRNFGTRDDVVVAAIRSCLVDQPTPDSGSLADDLAVLFGRYDHEDSRAVNQLLPLLLDERRRNPQIHETVDALLAERRRPLRTVIKLAQQRGEIDPDLDLDIALAMVLGPITYRRMVQEEPITDAFVAAVLPGTVAALRATVRFVAPA